MQLTDEQQAQWDKVQDDVAMEILNTIIASEQAIGQPLMEEGHKSLARRILSHPDIFVRDPDQSLPSVGVLDGLLKETWELCRAAMSKAHFAKVIPKEVEDGH